MAVPAWFRDVRKVFERQRVPDAVWIAIVFAESGGNPNARNRGTPGRPEDSVGLLQLNRRGGQGSGYSVEWLMNPVNNAELGGRAIAEAMQMRGDIIEIARNSGHPGLVPRNDARVVRIAQIYNAIAGAKTPEEKWEKATEIIGRPPPDGDQGDEDGGGWLPDGESIGRGIVRALTPDWLEGMDPIDLAWGWAFGMAGSVLIVVGLVGLVMSPKQVRQTIGSAISLIPTPATRAAGTGLVATSVGDTMVTPAAGGVVGQGAVRP